MQEQESPAVEMTSEVPVWPGLKYPIAQRTDQVDDYQGILVADPYRWLEDVESPEVRHWMQAESELTESVLSMAPWRDWIRRRLTEIWSTPQKQVPFRKGRRWFQFRNNGHQNQDELFTMDAADADGQPLLDPNEMASDSRLAVQFVEPSPDGALLAWSSIEAGSSWMTWHIRDVSTGRDLPDVLRWSKFSASWTKDGRGFFYVDFEPPPESETFSRLNLFPGIRYHLLGELQEQDQLVYERPDLPGATFLFRVTDDGRYLVVEVLEGGNPQRRVVYRDLEGSDEFVTLIGEPDAHYLYLANDGFIWYLQTDHAAPNGRVVSVDIRDPERSQWQTIVPEGETVLQPWLPGCVVGRNVVTVGMVEGATKATLTGLDGTPRGVIQLPGPGTIRLGHSNRDDDSLYFLFTSFLTRGTILRYDFASGNTTTLFAPAQDADPDGYSSETVSVPSLDGSERIPMTVIRRKDVMRSGDVPTLMIGYGGFGIPHLPQFATANLVWMELGGALAWTQLRGGGEYGSRWHDAGRLANKQNVFDDFISCAEWLISSGWTRPDRLAMEGGSNGGLLVGATLTQRPDLFGACISEVGVLDMLRFHRWTSGAWWVGDYGSSDDPEQFGWLYAYSPVHRVKEGVAYPATLVMAGDHDDHVVPGHSLKFAAALQAAQSGSAPVLLRVDFDTGHGAGKPLAKQIASRTDALTFLVQALELEPCILGRQEETV